MIQSGKLLTGQPHPLRDLARHYVSARLPEFSGENEGTSPPIREHIIQPDGGVAEHETLPTIYQPMSVDPASMGLVPGLLHPIRTVPWEQLSSCCL